MAWLAFSIPGGVVVLLVVGLYETRRRRARPGPTLSATYVNEITALFSTAPNAPNSTIAIRGR